MISVAGRRPERWLSSAVPVSPLCSPLPKTQVPHLVSLGLYRIGVPWTMLHCTREDFAQQPTTCYPGMMCTNSEPSLPAMNQDRPGDPRAENVKFTLLLSKQRKTSAHWTGHFKSERPQVTTQIMVQL